MRERRESCAFPLLRSRGRIGGFKKERRLGSGIDDKPVTPPRVAVHRPYGKRAVLLLQRVKGRPEQGGSGLVVGAGVVADDSHPVRFENGSIAPPQRCMG